MGHQLKMASLGVLLVISMISSVHGACTFLPIANARPNPATLAAQTSYLKNGATIPISKYSECLDACSLAPTCIAGAYQTSSNTCVFSSVTYNPATNDLSATSAGYQLFSVTGTTGPTTFECPTRTPGGTPTPATTPSPTAGPTPSAACPNFNTKLDNTNAEGGSFRQTITSEAACKAQCTAEITCLAIDWAPFDLTSKCWIHTDPTKVAAPRTGLAPSVTFFVIDRVCSTPAPTAGPTPPPTTDCTGSFTTLLNNHINGGNPQHSVATQAACQQACLNDATCLSYDWAPNDPSSKCWLHPTTTTTTAAQSITHYTLNSGTRVCPNACLGQYTEYPDSNVPGGTAQPSASTVEACKAVCLGSTQCAGFDFDSRTTSTYRCWTLSSVAGIQPGQTGVQHYTLTSRSCTDQVTTAQPCTNSFQESPNSNVDGGTYDASAATLDVCKANCIANTNCIGLDFAESAAQKCWIITVNNGLNQGRTGVNHHAISRPTGAGCFTTTGGCVDSFTEFPSQNADGGVAYSQHTDLEQCKQECTNNALCVGLDWSPNYSVKCWLHLNAANLNNINQNVNGVNMHRLTRCEFTTVVATTVDACSPTWTLMENTNSNGGVGYPTIGTLEACWAKCIEEADCVGLDYDASNGNAKCWLHKDVTNFNNVQTSTGVMQHRLTRTCDETTVEATTTSGVCTPTWEIARNMHGDGATAQAGLATLEDCQNACVENQNCNGLDYDIGGTTKCWLYFKTISSTDLGVLTGVDNYILKERCPDATTAGCVPTFDLRPSSSAQGGRAEPSISTIDGCKSLCVNEVGCVGFDYDKSAGARASCWIHTNPSVLTNYNRVSNNIDMYILRDRCTGATTASGVCVPTFSTYASQGVAGGTADSAVTDLETCKARCNADTKCVALDYGNTAPKCWYHYVSGARRTANGVTHYNLDKRCEGAVTPSPSPTPTPSTPVPPGFCSADILFMVDSSGSINDNARNVPEKGWDIVKHYIADTVDALDIGYNLDRVSVITFSNSAQYRFHFDAYTDKNKLKDAIRDLPHSGGYTNTPMAFTLARESAFTAAGVTTSQSGDRPPNGVYRNVDILVLITDGEVTLGSADQMVRDATYLKNRGVNIVGVGISSVVNMNQISQVVSSQSYLYNVTNFADLRSHSNTLANAIKSVKLTACGGSPAPGPAPGPTPGPATGRPAVTTRSPGCVPQWIMNTNRNAAGGILQSDVAGFQTCQNRCVVTPWCTAIDWNPTTPQSQNLNYYCYLHTAGAVLATREGVTHYQLMRCP